jgi:hypothetical protein
MCGLPVIAHQHPSNVKTFTYILTVIKNVHHLIKLYRNPPSIKLIVYSTTSISLFCDYTQGYSMDTFTTLPIFNTRHLIIAR